ncbi:hypothetical protein OTU49_017323, partial [Cherax quadricarinatus]
TKQQVSRVFLFIVIPLLIFHVFSFHAQSKLSTFTKSQLELIDWPKIPRGYLCTMDDNQSLKLANLQQRLEESERNTILAATYGKQLLEQNQILHVKLEETVKEYATKVE